MELKDYLFGGNTRQMVYKALDASTMRNRAIANNLANVMTPGYQRVEVRFEEYLKDATRKKLPGAGDDLQHIPIGSNKGALKSIRPEAYLPPDPTLPGEVNNVDVDLEGSKLAENQLMYQYMLKFAGFDKFQAAIKGSGQ